MRRIPSAAGRLWSGLPIATKILLVFLPLIFLPLAAVAILALMSMKTVGHTAVSTTSDLGRRAQQESESTLRQNGRDQLLQLVNDQASDSNGLFSLVAGTTEVMADFAAAHWDDANPPAPELTLPVTASPADPTNANVYVVTPGADPAATAADLRRIGQLEDLFIAIGRHDPDLHPTIGTASGIVMNYPWIGPGSFPADYDPRLRPWYQAAAATDQLVWTEPILDPVSGQLGLYAARLVRDKQGMPVAVVNVSVDTTLVQQLSMAMVGNRGYAFVLDRHGDVVVPPSLTAGKGVQPDAEFSGATLLESRSADVRDVAQQMIAGQRGITSVKLGSGERFISFAPLPATGWSIGIVVPADQVIGVSNHVGQLFAALGQATQRIVDTRSAAEGRAFIAVAVAILVLASALAVTLSRTITGRLKRLGRAARALELGTLNNDDVQGLLASDGQDEIATLMRSFGRAAEQVQGRETSLRRQVQALSVEIDRSKAAQQVAAITETDFFRELQTKAKRMRQRSAGAKGDEDPRPISSTPA